MKYANNANEIALKTVFLVQETSYITSDYYYSWTGFIKGFIDYFDQSSWRDFKIIQISSSKKNFCGINEPFYIKVKVGINKTYTLKFITLSNNYKSNTIQLDFKFIGLQ